MLCLVDNYHYFFVYFLYDLAKEMEIELNDKNLPNSFIYGRVTAEGEVAERARILVG